MMTSMDHGSCSAEVGEARAGGRPVVALESTLIAHGLPWPDNLETARGAEEAVRRAGATPATIAVLGGVIRVGLSDEELERVARSGTFLKAGRRDLAAAVARGLDAATTVSATLWIARRRGIGVMATGGLGGVHRDAATTFDVSADLDELGRADGVVVTCSGVKSILDVPATLEVLETRGVAVVGYRTDEFPAFLTRSSGLPLDVRAESPGEVAALRGPIGRWASPARSSWPSRSPSPRRSTATPWRPPSPPWTRRTPSRSPARRSPRSCSTRSEG